MLNKLPRIEYFLENKVTSGLIIGLVVLLLAGVVFGYQKIVNKSAQIIPLQEVELSFDPEGPYALVLPRRDGNAINLNIRRISAYEAFSYQISYTDEQGIDRGAGDLNTWVTLDQGKSDYTQEILFGTCSKGNTSDPLHCVFDKGVEFGTLTLRFRKDNIAYKMLTTWHLQHPDIALGKLTSGDNHFIYTTLASRQDLSIVGLSIINDLSGAPKLPENKTVLGKVYAFNVPIAKVMPAGDVLVELAENPPQGANIFHYIEGKNEWQELETTTMGAKLFTKAETAGIFTVLVNSK